LGKKKYTLIIISLVLSVILYGFLYSRGMLAMTPGPGAALAGIPSEYVTHFVAILPGPLGTDILLLYLLPVVSFFIIFLIVPYITFIFLKVHQLTTKVGMKTQYGIVEVGEKVRMLRLFRRGFMVSLLSFTIAGLFVQAGFASTFREAGEDMILHEAEALFLGTFFLTFVALLIFLPIWYMEDSGVVGYKHDPDYRRAPKIEGISSIFSSLLEGYAGFATIFILVSYIFQSFSFILEAHGTLMHPALLTPLILMFLPFIIIGLFAIPLILYELTINKAVLRIHKRLKKLDYIQVPEFDDAKSYRDKF